MKYWLFLAALAAAPAPAQQRESLVTTRVTIAGEVKRELALTVDELRALGCKHGVVEKRGYAGVNTPVGGGVLVAYERDGQPLRDGEGAIALVSLEDQRPGTRHVKWLGKIEVRRVPE